MRVAWFPKPSAYGGNPYWELLHRHLAALGVEFETSHDGHWMSGRWLWANRGRVQVLHFHWIQSHYAGMEETGLELLTSVLGDGEYPFESCQTAAEHAVARAWKPVHEPLPYEEALALLDRLIGLMRKFDRNLAAEIARVVSFDAYRKDKTSGALRYGVMALRISPTTWSDRGLWKRTLACVTRRVIG
jgi:hypothetical protein